MVLKANRTRSATSAGTERQQTTRKSSPTEASDESTYGALINSAPVFFHRTAPNGDLLWCSEQFYLYTGLSPEDALNQAWQERGLVHPDDLQSTIEGWSEKSRTGAPFDLEMRLRGKDGSYRWHLSNQVPVRDDSGRIVEWIGTSTDIDDRTRIEKALRESEERFRLLANSAPVLIWVNNLDGCEFVNSEYLNFLGRTMDEVEGMRWAEAVHPDDFDSYVGGYTEALEKRIPFESQVRLRRADGVYRWFKSVGMPRFSPDGELLGYVGSSTDITDAKLVEESLRESERRLRVLTETAPVFVFRADASGRVTYASERFYDYTGLTPEAVEGDRWQLTDLIHPDDRMGAVEGWGRAVATGRSDGAEVRLRGADGSYRWYLTRVAPVLDETGAVLDWAGTSTDIHDRKQMEVSLRESEEDLRDFFVNSAVPLHWVGPDGTILRVNAAELGLLGYAEDEYVGHHIAEFHADQHVIEDILARLTAGETINDYPARLLCKDGSIKHVLIDSSVLRREEEFIHTRCFTRDVTAAKLAQEAMNAALIGEATARSLVDAMIDAVPAGICFFDRDLRFLTLNRAAAEINGLSIEEHIGKVAPELLPGLPQQVWDTNRIVGETGVAIRDVEISTEAPAAPGSMRWWTISCYPVMAPDGEVTGTVEVFSEITERKRADIARSFIADATAALASSLDHEQTLREVARLAVPSVCDVCVVDIIGKDGEPRRLDGVGATELEAELIAGIHMRDWRLPGDEEGVVKNALVEGRPIFLPMITPELLDTLAPNETQRRLAQALAPVSVIQLPLTARGGVFGAVTFVITRSPRRFDTADLAMAEEFGRRASIAADNARLYAEAQATMAELRRASAVKDEFLSLVSHELRTPITTIYGNSKLIRDKFERLSEDDRWQAAQDLSEEAERLHRIVENLLLLTQLESGKTLEVEPIHLPNLVRRWLALFEKREPKRRVELVAEGPVPAALGVPTYVELACDNLLSNAHKYSPIDEPIRVTVGVSGDGSPQVTVRDRGPGIDPGEAEQLFTPFFRSSRTERGAKGIGIGLAVTKRVIEAQGGTVWGTSLDGGGAEFGFSLASIAYDA